MIQDDLPGPRLGELLLAELVGRELGPLGSLTVAGLDHPAGFTCSAGETYRVLADGDEVAQVVVGEDAIVLTFEDDRRLRVERGASIKDALDVLVTRRR